MKLWEYRFFGAYKFTTRVVFDFYFCLLILPNNLTYKKLCSSIIYIMFDCVKLQNNEYI